MLTLACALKAQAAAHLHRPKLIMARASDALAQESCCCFAATRRRCCCRGCGSSLTSASSSWDNGSYPAMLGMLSETKLGPSVDNHQVPCVQWSSQSTMSLAWGWPHSTTKCQLLPPFLEVAINQA